VAAIPLAGAVPSLCSAVQRSAVTNDEEPAGHPAGGLRFFFALMFVPVGIRAERGDRPLSVELSRHGPTWRFRHRPRGGSTGAGL